MIRFLYCILSIFIVCTHGKAAEEWSDGGQTDGLVESLIALPDTSGFLFTLKHTPNYNDANQPHLPHIMRFTSSNHSIDTIQYSRPTSDYSKLSSNGLVMLFYDELTHKISIVSLAQRDTIAHFELSDIRSIPFLSFSPDDKEVLVVIRTSLSMVFLRLDIATQKTVQSFAMKPKGRLQNSTPFSMFSLSDNGTLLYATTQVRITQDISITVLETWDTKTETYTDYTISSYLDNRYIQDVGSIYGVYLLPHSKMIPVIFNLTTGDTTTLYQFKNTWYVQFLHHDSLLAITTQHEGYASITLIKTGTWEITTSFTVSTYANIRRMVLSPDKRVLSIAYRVYSCSDKENGKKTDIIGTSLAFFDTRTGERLLSYPTTGHIAAVNSMAWSPNGAMVASSGYDYQTIVRDAKTGYSLARLPGTGSLLFTHNSSSLLRVWGNFIEEIDITSATVTRRVPHSFPFRYNNMSPDRYIVPSHNAPIAAAVGEEAIVIFSTTDLQELTRLTIPKGVSIQAVRFTPNNDSIVAFIKPEYSYADSMFVAIWGVSDGTLLSTFTFKALYQNTITSVELSHDCQYVATFSMSSHLGAIYSLRGKRIRGFSATTMEESNSEFTYDGRYLIIGNTEFVYRPYTPLPQYNIIRRISIHGNGNNILEEFKPTNTISLLRVSPYNNSLIFTYKSSSMEQCRAGTVIKRSLAPPADLAISTHAVNFGNVFSGETHRQSLTITSNNNVPLIVTHIVLNSKAILSGAKVQYSNTLPDTLLPGEEALITITLAPTYPRHNLAQSTIGTLIISSNDSFFSDTTIPIYGSIIGPSIATSVDVDTIDFGKVFIGETRVEKIYVFPKNQAALIVKQVYIDTTMPQQFAFTLPKNLPLTLTNNDSLMITILYTPTQEKEIRSALNIISTDIQDTIYHIPLTGQGLSTVDVPTITPPSGPNTMSLAPNPAASVLHLRFAMNTPGIARAQLFSAQGKLVRTWLDKPLGVGVQQFSFTVEGIAPSVYYCVLTTPAGTTAQPLLVAP